jgi:hypothetical protein
MAKRGNLRVILGNSNNPHDLLPSRNRRDCAISRNQQDFIYYLRTEHVAQRMPGPLYQSFIEGLGEPYRPYEDCEGNCKCAATGWVLTTTEVVCGRPVHSPVGVVECSG